jgi:hypothetical protein
MIRVSRFLFLAATVVLAASACTSDVVGGQPFPDATATTAAVTPVSTTSITTPAPATTTTTTTTTVPSYLLSGVVKTVAGGPAPGTVVELAGRQTVTDEAGVFSFAGVPAGTISFVRPAWQPTTVEWDGKGPVEAFVEPLVVRGLRVSRYVAGDPDAFARLLDLADSTIVNTLVFDTKDETGQVLYQSSVATATEIGAVREVYDPVELLAQAKEGGYYAITRIVTFEDQIWSRQMPETKLAGIWMDSRIESNWEYPLGLAVEACELGFDEIQFDYVRWPTGATARAYQSRAPATQQERVDSITAFLAEAKNRLHAMGCGVSAAIFGIVVSSPDDQGIGQRPEEVSTVVDAVSPMVYPSHYSNGWLGFDDPNDHPAAVTADALDDGMPRLAETALMRPWLQGFWWTNSQIKASVEEAEARGVGWMIWNAPGNYSAEAIPSARTGG